jgi:hypothetical protein
VFALADLTQNLLLVSANDGTSWSAGPTSPGPGGGPYGIWGSGASDIYVAGATANGALIGHYDGSGNLVPEALPASIVGDGFAAVWGSSATDVYAVGTGQGGTTGRVAHKL